LESLDKLVKRRNLASYDLKPTPLFATSRQPGCDQLTANALAVLDRSTETLFGARSHCFVPTVTIFIRGGGE